MSRTTDRLALGFLTLALGAIVLALVFLLIFLVELFPYLVGIPCGIAVLMLLAYVLGYGMEG